MSRCRTSRYELVKGHPLVNLLLWIGAELLGAALFSFVLMNVLSLQIEFWVLFLGVLITEILVTMLLFAIFAGGLATVLTVEAVDEKLRQRGRKQKRKGGK